VPVVGWEAAGEVVQEGGLLAGQRIEHTAPAQEHARKSAEDRRRGNTPCTDGIY
jgi:hypothetical protein